MQGLGVGLSLSNLYATHFGGSFRIKSEGEGLGVTVEFTIPRNIDVLEASFQSASFKNNVL